MINIEQEYERILKLYEAMKSLDYNALTKEEQIAYIRILGIAELMNEL